jgi:hypothetical protein
MKTSWRSGRSEFPLSSGVGASDLSPDDCLDYRQRKAQGEKKENKGGMAGLILFFLHAGSQDAVIPPGLAS